MSDSTERTPTDLPISAAVNPLDDQNAPSAVRCDASNSKMRAPWPKPDRGIGFLRIAHGLMEIKRNPGRGIRLKASSCSEPTYQRGAIVELNAVGRRYARGEVSGFAPLSS